MMASDEQSTVAAKARIAELKKAYMAALARHLANSKAQATDRFQANYLTCQQAGNEYFNYAEEFVGNSDLLGAHANGIWVTGFAEDCFEILRTLPAHYGYLREHAEAAGVSPRSVEPGAMAFSNMQRMVVTYLDKTRCNTLQGELVAARLPIHGFKVRAMDDKPKTWEKILCAVTGILLLITILILVVFVPEPTPMQVFVFRLFLATGVAALGAIIPGFLNVRVDSTGIGIRATGAIALFVIVWLINPPELIARPASANTFSVTAPEKP